MQARKPQVKNEPNTNGGNFHGFNFSEEALTKGEYEKCRFVNCIFSHTDLADIVFEDCEFTGCDLSMAKIKNVSFRDVLFKDCKLVGVHFNECRKFLFSASFESSQLHLSTFYQLDLKNTKFKNCNLSEVDFTEADLTGSVFDNCDLIRTIFENTLLEKVDFRSAFNYSIDPEINKIRRAKFSMTGIAGLLDKYNIEIE